MRDLTLRGIRVSQLQGFERLLSHLQLVIALVLCSSVTQDSANTDNATSPADNSTGRR